MKKLVSNMVGVDAIRTRVVVIGGHVRVIQRMVASCVWACLVLNSIVCTWAIDPINIEYLWQSQPLLDFDWRGPPVVPNIHVTIEHLNASSVRERMHAAQSILRAPSSPNLDRPALLSALIDRLQAGEPHRLVRVEMLAAACELDDGAHSQQLWTLAQGDTDAESIVQQSCIRWRVSLPLERWRASLTAATSSEQVLLQAIDGLGATGTEADVKLLEAVVLDGTRSSPLLLSSARAIGSIATSDQMPLAQKLRASTADQAELLAVEVLAKSPVPAATQFVQDISLNGMPLAQRSAYRWLCERDSSVAQDLAAKFLKHNDPEVRLLALGQITIADIEETLAALFDAFHDPNPNVRSAARGHVLTCCSRTDGHVLRAVRLLKRSMDDADWRTLEQSIRLTVELKQNDYCERLMTLIEHERPEVCITAGWALRNLAEDDAMLQRMLDRVKQLTSKLMEDSGGGITEMQMRCAAHMLEAFGHRKFEPAKETVLQYVPKVFRLGIITRMAAIWTCGQLWEKSENKQLIKELHARIADKNTMFPESPSVRFAATLALGWISDPDSREPLIAYDEPKPMPIGYATEWALKRLNSNGN